MVTCLGGFLFGWWFVWCGVWFGVYWFVEVGGVFVGLRFPWVFLILMRDLVFRFNVFVMRQLFIWVVVAVG